MQMQGRAKFSHSPETWDDRSATPEPPDCPGPHKQEPTKEGAKRKGGKERFQWRGRSSNYNVTSKQLLP